MTALGRIIGDRTPGELGLLLMFLVVGAYMFVDAGSYGGTIGLYPRLLSGVVLLCTLLLVFQGVLPDRLRRDVSESSGAIGSTDLSDEIDRDDVDTPDAVSMGPGETSRMQVVLTLLIGGYLLLSYLVGMYYATPFFVILYGIVYRLTWKETVLLTAVASILAHLFLIVFNAPIASGVLL